MKDKKKEYVFKVIQFRSGKDKQSQSGQPTTPNVIQFKRNPRMKFASWEFHSSNGLQIPDDPDSDPAPAEFVLSEKEFKMHGEPTVHRPHPWLEIRQTKAGRKVKDPFTGNFLLENERRIQLVEIRDVKESDV
jgi:hypothetical protein